MLRANRCPELFSICPFRLAFMLFALCGCADVPHDEIQSADLLILDTPQRCAAIAFTPDNRAIAWSSGSFRGTIRYTSIRTGKVIKEFESFGSKPIFSRDGNTLAAFHPHTHSSVAFHDATDGKLLGGYTFFDSYSMAMSNDGKVAALGSLLNRIGLCRVPSGEQITVLRFDRDQSDGFISSMRFSTDDRLLTAAHRDGSIRIWDLQTEKLASKVNLFYGGRNNRITLSPDSKIAACVLGESLTESDSSILLYNTKDATRRTTLKGHVDGDLSTCFSPDSKLIASTSEDLTVRIWDVATGKQLHVIRTSRRRGWKRETLGNGEIWVDQGGKQRFCRLTGLVFSSCGTRLAWIEQERVNDLTDVIYTIRVVELKSKPKAP